MAATSSIPPKKRQLSSPIEETENNAFLPGKKQWKVLNQPTTSEITNSPLTGDVSSLPSKKRWLKTNVTENPSKKRVSLSEYLQRKNCHDNSDSDFSCDLESAKNQSDPNNGILNNLPIHSLEERKKELQKALLSMEERRKRQNNDQQQEHKHHNHRHRHHHKVNAEKSKIKEINKKQIKDFSHFVKKQEKRLKIRQEKKKSSSLNDNSNSNGLTSTVNQFKLINENLKLEIQKLKAQQENNNNKNI